MPDSVYSFILRGPPCTKKTSQHAFFHPHLGRTVIVPDALYTRWFRDAMSQSPLIRSLLREAGAILPIRNEVSVRALFYRPEDTTGDSVGYYQALGDWLQESRLRPKRNGAGIIVDDRLIRDWDGSRRLIDRADPRTEVTITVLGAVQPPLIEQPERSGAALERPRPTHNRSITKETLK